MIKLIQMNKPKNNSIYIYISDHISKKHIYTILIMVNLCWSTKKTNLLLDMVMFHSHPVSRNWAPAGTPRGQLAHIVHRTLLVGLLLFKTVQKLENLQRKS